MFEWAKTVVDVAGLRKAERNGYRQCIQAGPLVFVSGQSGLDADFNVVSPDFAPQVRQTFHNIGLALAACGGGLRDIVAMTVYLTDLRHFEEFVQLRKEILGDELATSAVVGVAQLAYPGLLIEIQATAVVSHA
jgi:2-iminobutanoate/2-iminopropanoate deaminase